MVYAAAGFVLLYLWIMLGFVVNLLCKFVGFLLVKLVGLRSWFGYIWFGWDCGVVAFGLAFLCFSVICF